MASAKKSVAGSHQVWRWVFQTHWLRVFLPACTLFSTPLLRSGTDETSSLLCLAAFQPCSHFTTTSENRPTASSPKHRGLLQLHSLPQKLLWTLLKPQK